MGKCLISSAGSGKSAQSRSGCNASSRTICYCRHHVGNVSCTQGLLRSLVPTVRNSKGSELRDPGKGRNDIHDVDGACSGLWASRGCWTDLQDGTDNVGGCIGHLIVYPQWWPFHMPIKSHIHHEHNKTRISEEDRCGLYYVNYVTLQLQPYPDSNVSCQRRKEPIQYNYCSYYNSKACLITALTCQNP